MSSRCLSPGSSQTRTLKLAERWIPGTRPGMTKIPPMAQSHTLPGNATTAAVDTTAVRIWLLTVAALVFLLVSVGGATRLTGSGLSITEWKPIMGIVPPLSEADWHDAFEKYRQIPQ